MRGTSALRIRNGSWGPRGPGEPEDSLAGRHFVDDWNAGRRSEVELRRRDGYVRLFAGEGEASVGAIGFLDFDAEDGAVGGHVQGEALDALFLIVRNAGKSEGSVCGGSDDKV